MKICLNLLAATAGGQLTRARAFLDRFEQHAKDCELLVLKEQQVLPEYGSRSRREVLNVAIGLGRLKALRRMVWETVAMPRVLRQRQVEVYLTFSHYLPSTVPSHVASVVGVSNLAPFSDLAWSEEGLVVRLKMALLRRSIVGSARRATSVIALSNACRAMLEQAGIAAGAIETIPNGVDDFWRETDSQTASVPWDNFLLYVSHFHRYKNHARLLRAYSQLPLQLRQSHPLVMVGRSYDRRYYREIRALTSQLGLNKQVVIEPGKDTASIRALYHRATLFLFPSMIENCPNILLEAMASGAAVLASNQPPMPEFGGDGAVYCDPLDVHGMTRSMESLLNDSGRRKRMGERAAVLAQRYSWEEFVGRVIDVCARASKTVPNHASIGQPPCRPLTNSRHAR